MVIFFVELDVVVLEAACPQNFATESILRGTKSSFITRGWFDHKSWRKAGNQIKNLVNHQA